MTEIIENNWDGLCPNCGETMTMQDMQWHGAGDDYLVFYHDCDNDKCMTRVSVEYYVTLKRIAYDEET